MELQRYQVKESFPSNRDFQNAAVDLMPYAENGMQTELGMTWAESETYENRMRPCAGHIDFNVDPYGYVHIKEDTPIMAGYSFCELGGEFTFSWTIREGEYYMTDITFWDAARGSFC